ncbi:hypothetical protein [Actinoplanes sp. RD1]|uniref:hypothetical protein n=1 Tax=Actinoplanes sp. RD1 TaxID=3064538 RepID=UPI0027412D00|nr:hypothetical protein [Actinoplanes sp. RD1]
MTVFDQRDDDGVREAAAVCPAASIVSPSAPGPGSLSITGTDLLVDGGQAAWLRWYRPQPAGV